MKPLVEGLVLKWVEPALCVEVAEAPRGGAGIEIGRWRPGAVLRPKPLVEGLVLKLHGPAGALGDLFEAPRGGAGIEIRGECWAGGSRLKPLVEGLVLKYRSPHNLLFRPGSPSWRGWY